MARILHLLSEDLATGTLRQIELLCQGLDQLGFDQALCSLEPNHQRRGTLPSFTGPTLFCGFHGNLDPTFLLRLRRQLWHVNPALIQTWGSTAGNIGQLLTLHGQIPIVRAIRSFEKPSFPIPFLDRWWARQVTRIIVNSDQLKTLLAARGVPDRLIAVVGNAVAPTSRLDSVRPLPAQLGLDDSARFVVVIGDLREKKRIKDLIWAMDLLRVIHPMMHLLIVGEGDELGRLRQFDRDVNLDPCVHFLGRRDDVRELLPQCFCLWQASRDEGCSNAVLEAMSAGLPVVASDIPGHRSTVVDGETGFLVPLGDCAEFARKTNWLLQHENGSQEMGQAGRGLVGDHYSVKQMVDGYRDIYRAILEGRSGRAA